VLHLVQSKLISTRDTNRCHNKNLTAFVFMITEEQNKISYKPNAHTHRVNYMVMVQIPQKV